MKYITKIILIFSFSLFHVNISEAQQKENSTIVVKSVVIDTNKNPIPDVIISVQNGRDYVRSDKKGAFTIDCHSNEILIIEAKGFKSLTIPVNLISQNITLEEAPFQLSENDIVRLPFGSLYKRQIVGAVSTLFTDDIDSYDATQNFSTALASRTLGLFGGKDIRGLGYTVIVDGMKRGGNTTLEIFSDMIDLEEIAEISILKDVSSRILFGSHADNGVILITTKRGIPNKNKISLFVETGLSDPISFPEYLNSADYMTLFNEALYNDGLPAKYDPTTIENSRNGTDIYKYPNQDFYSSEFLKSFKPFNKAIANFSGGNSKNRYYLNIGYTGTGSLLKIGEGANETDNQVNIRANLDSEINKWISVNIGASSIVNFYHSPEYLSGNFWTYASSVRPMDLTHLLPIDRINSENNELVEGATKINNQYILGGNSIYTQNIYGDLYHGGYVDGMRRNVQLNIGLNFNLDFLIEKLKYQTYFTYDNFNRYQTYQSNQYAIYEPNFISGDSININKIGVDNFVGSQGTRNTFFYRLYGWSNVLSYNNIFNDIHSLNATAVTKIDSYKEGGFNYNDKHVNAGIRLNYMFKNKYVVEFNGSVVGSPRFGKEERWGFSPVLGLAWIASEEESLKNSSFLNYLKFKSTYGNIKTDIDDAFSVSNYYMYQDMYKQGGNFNYSDGTSANKLTQIFNIGNKNISWIERNELNIGVETSMFNNSLFTEINYFNSKRINEIGQRSNFYMQFLGGNTFLPYQNFGARTTQGFEFGLNYEKKYGNLKCNIGLNVITINPKLDKVDELDYGPGLEYRQKAGKPYDAIWGLEAIGLFKDDQDIATSPIQKFGTILPGDIKYRDLNGDNIIDEDDQTVLGYFHARNNYVFSINLNYKRFDFFTYLNMQTGGSSYYKNNYYWVSGELKYPKHVNGRWAYNPDKGIDTRETATYPRLSSKSNPNNMRNSSYWLYKKDHVTIPVIQMTYTFPEFISKKIFVNNLSVFCRVTNVLMVGDNKDKMQLNTDSEPQMRNYSIGLKARF